MVKGEWFGVIKSVKVNIFLLMLSVSVISVTNDPFGKMPKIRYWKKYNST